MTEQLGVQLTPWAAAPELVAMGVQLREQVDTVFVQDQLLARHAFSVLAALAANGCGVGTNVTWPFGRNPIEMASAVATITELLHAGRTMTVGMGSGGALAAALLDMSGRAEVVRETVLMMKALWAGEDVSLDEYPVIGRRVGFLPGAVARLTYAVERPPTIVIAGVGPRITEVAARDADGTISASNLPVYSRAALESGVHDELSNAAPLRQRAERDPSFRMHYGMNLSVSADGARARAHASRQAALIVGNPGMWPAMERIGLDMESVHSVKAAFDDGLGVEGASARVSAGVADALIVSGTPDEVVVRLSELRKLALGHGYTDFFLGAPLGPDPTEAAQLLSAAVIPQIWPDRQPT
ncbi:MAG: LLM class flavin-dependent oxidoreductase [Acidimicrobiia bacterium]